MHLLSHKDIQEIKDFLTITLVSMKNISFLSNLMINISYDLMMAEYFIHHVISCYIHKKTVQINYK